MTITRKEWQAYIERLAKIESKAADLMRTAVRIHGFDDLGALISYGRSPPHTARPQLRSPPTCTTP